MAGPAPGGAPPVPPGGGVGGAGGFKKGGFVERVHHPEKRGAKESFGKKPMKFAKGGSVRSGGDSKPRYKSPGSFK
jgi:hypothetical protein